MDGGEAMSAAMRAGGANSFIVVKVACLSNAPTDSSIENPMISARIATYAVTIPRTGQTIVGAFFAGVTPRVSKVPVQTTSIA